MYNRLPEDEPSGSKYVEDIINWNINLEKVHFWFMLYYLKKHNSKNINQLYFTINPLKPELNPSAQRCLPTFLLGILILNGSLRDVFISRSALKC
jgi:hypothetical protein